MYPIVQGGKRNKITHCSVKAPTIGSHIVVHGQKQKAEPWLYSVVMSLL